MKLKKNVPELVTVDLSDDMFCIMFQQKFKNIPPPYLLLHNGENTDMTDYQVI